MKTVKLHLKLLQASLRLRYMIESILFITCLTNEGELRGGNQFPFTKSRRFRGYACVIHQHLKLLVTLMTSLATVSSSRTQLQVAYTEHFLIMVSST